MIRTAKGFLRGDSNLYFDAIFIPKGTDISGNGKHASDTGTLGVPFRLAKARASRRVWARGTGEYFSYGSSDTLDPGVSAFSMGMIIKVHAAQSDQVLFNNQNGPTQGFFLSVRGTPSKADFQGNTSAASWAGSVTGNTPIQDGQEIFVVGVCDGTQRRVYLNGIQDGYATAAGNYNAGTLAALTSAYANNTGFSGARLDMEVVEIFAIKRALSPVEIASMWRNYKKVNPLNGLLADVMQLIGVADSGSGSDAQSILAQIAASDSGAASDAMANILAQITRTESGSGSETIALLANIALSDTGFSADAITLLATIAISDTALSADAISVLAQITQSDNGSAVDALVQILAQISQSDSGSASDALSLIVALALAENGSGADALSIFQTRSVSDSGSANDVISALITVAQSDTGVAVDAISVLAELILADAGVASENVIANAIINLSDAGAAMDAANFLITLAQSDSALADDAIEAIGLVALNDSAIATEAIEAFRRVYPYLKKSSPYNKKQSPYSPLV